MATLTLRDLDESLKLSLRMRAARHNRSMEEEARQILRAALAAPEPPALNLFDSIRSHFEGLGDVQLDIPPREPPREPPDFSHFDVAKRVRTSAAKPAARPAAKTAARTRKPARPSRSGVE
jgi:antitoxin FitA